MKQIILIPDSFKGTLSAVDFCCLGEQVIRNHLPDCRVLTIPVADGGEGTVDCFIRALQAQRVSVEVTGPWGERVVADYAVHGDTAFVALRFFHFLFLQCFGLQCLRQIVHFPPFPLLNKKQMLRHYYSRRFFRLVQLLSTTLNL